MDREALKKCLDAWCRQQEKTRPRERALPLAGKRPALSEVLRSGEAAARPPVAPLVEGAPRLTKAMTAHAKHAPGTPMFDLSPEDKAAARLTVRRQPKDKHEPEK
jgi:hypothetical protein